MATIMGALMMIDGAIYNLICYVYEIFYYLATLNIFTEEHYQGIVSRIYVILGLFMLFVLAYSLLRAIINPDDFAKGEQSFPNLIKNVLISLVIIILLPTVFSVAFNIQNVVLNNDTIPKLILGVDEATEDNSGGGRMIAYYLYKAFLYPNSEVCGSSDIEDCRANINGNGWIGFRNGDPLNELDADVLNGASFINYKAYSEAVRDGDLTYLFPISTVAGIFTLYVLLNFCFDMAIRVVKLAFYQIIAPIPVICRIIPGGSMKDVFSKWVKQIVSIFLEVFIRIGVLAICIYLINIVVDAYEAGLPGIDSLGVTQKPIVLALIIMGIVIFMKQAPQILGDLLNLKTDGMKLGLMDKLAMGGGLLAGAVAGGGLTTFARNAVTARRNFNATKGQGFKARAGALAGGAASIFAGTVSGAARSGVGARGAKNFRDMAGAAGKGAADATAARDRRKANVARYRAQGGNAFTRTALGGHIVDFGHSVQDWATGGIGQYDARIKLGNEFKSAGDAIFDEAGKILTKNSNNVDMVASMVDSNGASKFKGDPNGELLDLYQGYSGMSLSAIEADINRQANVVDFSALVNREAFEKEKIDMATGTKSKVFDAKGYQDAIDREARKHAAKMANLRSMYSQLEKETKMKIVDTALNSNMSISGIDDEKLQAIRDKVGAFKEQYSQVGSTVIDPASGKSYGQISQSGHVAKEIDDIATAFANVSSEASVNAARHRQAMEARKGNK